MTFEDIRAKYKEFIFNDFSVCKITGGIKVVYDFEIPGLCKFTPELIFEISDDLIVNSFDGPLARKIILSLGMVEAVSYFKSVCPQLMTVRCGELSVEEIQFFKKLYYKGLGEFFYINNIEIPFRKFLQIRCEGNREEETRDKFISRNLNIIPVGGGKDSDVTISLSAKYRDENYFITVNHQKAREDAVLVSGYTKDKIININRTIDPNLLELNKKGFLNGHTPFSAIVAFTGLYTAYLMGANYLVLSNEASANESNIEGLDINHQYSKSFEFEKNISEYIKSYLIPDIKYFSLLRPFNELQIAKYFASLPEFHNIFVSCNVGSKENRWCGKCAKCLFVYSMLSAFMEEEKLIKIFGENLLDNKELISIFDGLVGFTQVKPFECVGTRAEIKAALSKTVEKYLSEGRALPQLLEYFNSKTEIDTENFDKLLRYFNYEHSVPNKFKYAIEEFKQYVRSTK
ncbi:MAG: hypothetical protein Q4E28_00500 [Clostridia bacterium]|nr:hypothetical protein [Clostridia bacterium]